MADETNKVPTPAPIKPTTPQAVPAPAKLRQRPGKRGPAHRLDDTATQETFIVKVEAIGSVRGAAGFVRMSLSSAKRFINANPDFAEQVDAAKHRCMCHHLSRVAEGVKEWRASAWILERLFWEDCGRRDPGAITIEKFTEALRHVADAILPVIPQELHAEIEARMLRIVRALTPTDSEKHAVDSETEV